MTSRLARAGVVGAMALGAIVAVTSFGAPGGAQADATTNITNPGFDRSPAISHDGRWIVFVTSSDADGSESSLVLHDRGSIAPDGSVLPATTTPIADSSGATDPAISGNGCVITWSVRRDDADVQPVPPEPPAPEPPVTEAPGDGEEPDPTTPGDDAAVNRIGERTGGVGERIETDEPGESRATDTGPSDTGPSDTGTSDTGTSSTAPSDTGSRGAGAGDPDDDTTVVELAPLEAAPSRLVALDRCASATGSRVELASGGDVRFGPAAPSFDGSVIAVSNGSEVVRFARRADGRYAEADRFDGRDDAGTDLLVADRVDVSDDGSVVVFAGGLDLADPSAMTVFAHVVQNGRASTDAVLTSAIAPSVSADGTLVVGSSGPGGSSVVLVDRTTDPLAPVDLGPGRRPAISADGNHVVLEEGANVAVVSRTGQGDVAFATTTRTLLSTTITPTRSGPAVDRLGSTVVTDLVADGVDASPGTDIAVTEVPADAGFDAARFDLGAGDVGAELTSTVTFSNGGPSSVGVASLEVDGTFLIAEDRCGSEIRPVTTCEIDVTFSVERLEDAIGVVTLTPTRPGVAAFTTEVVALGEAPPVSTSATTTTVARTGGATTTGGTRGTTTRGSTTRGSTTRGTSTTGGSRSTTTTIPAGAGLVASPATFDFAPTIIDAGRRTGLVEIVNNGSAGATIDAVEPDPSGPGPFQIVETTCTVGQTLAAGARCAVTLSFEPTAMGAQNASLIVSVRGGTDITVPVTGTGAAAPTIAVIPGVATVGQVVTLSGNGFPTGLTVDVAWGAGVQQVVVDDAGTFAVPVVVMSHTATGPATVSVAGQADLFDTVSATMLVTDTSTRSRAVVLDGVGVDIGR